MKLRPQIIAIAAIMTAIVTVFTLVVRVPIPATQGFFNFSDVAIYFAAFAFGPLIGLVAGGVGTAIADVLAGYAAYAPITLFSHGLQGGLAGWLGYRRGLPWMIAGWAAGTIVMMGGYFVYQWVLFGLGPAAVELPWNLVQNVGGGLIGIPLLYLVRRAYPPIHDMAQPRRWREE
jgi:uncharacterized membrane protein